MHIKRCMQEQWLPARWQTTAFAIFHAVASKATDDGKGLIFIFQDDKCRYNPFTKGATDVGFVDVEEGNEKKLQQAVATVGPVSVAIDASHESFQFYKEGMFIT